MNEEDMEVIGTEQIELTLPSGFSCKLISGKHGVEDLCGLALDVYDKTKSQDKKSAPGVN